MEYSFELNDLTNLIIVQVIVNNSKLKFGLDTGASNTIIDETALIIAGGTIMETFPRPLFETASGYVQASEGMIRRFMSLGQTYSNFKAFAYNFMQNSLYTDVDGLLGLDFFAGRKLCIDFPKKTITLTAEANG